MPRCQRTFRYLLSSTVVPEAGGKQWTCPHCSEQEVYTSLRIPELLAYAAFAEKACLTHFGLPADHERPSAFWWGIRPECVYESNDRRYDIYLASDSDPWQARLQIGHELFHRIAGEGQIFHWTHEMLACLISVRLLEQHGEKEYAAKVVAQYTQEAEYCSRNRLLEMDPWAEAVYPVGYYGQAFVMGMALQDAVGWGELCHLARAPVVATGQPDVNGWLNDLSNSQRHGAELVLFG